LRLRWHDLWKATADRASEPRERKPSLGCNTLGWRGIGYCGQVQLRQTDQYGKTAVC
jgi:hypothetical protein